LEAADFLVEPFCAIAPLYGAKSPECLIADAPSAAAYGRAAHRPRRWRAVYSSSPRSTGLPR